MKRSILIQLIFILALWMFISPAYGMTTITFENGLTSDTHPVGLAVGDYYASLGMTTPNLRFHLCTHTAAVPFNFVDNWGAMVDYGVLHTTTGFIEFINPVKYVEIDALALSSFDLNGTEPYSWSITAFNYLGVQVDIASEMYGFDFAGKKNPPDTDLYPLAILSLRVEAPEGISRLEINPLTKFGIDTIRFESLSVPEPATSLLLVLGLIGLVGTRKRLEDKK